MTVCPDARGRRFAAGCIEGLYSLALRGQRGKNVFPDARGFRRLAAPRFEPPSGWRPGRLRFRPQSGLVQRGVINAACRQRWWAPLKMKGAMMIKPYNRPAGEGKQANRPAGVAMHPFCRLRRRLSTGKRLTRFSGRFCSPTNHVRLPPRRGRFALCSAFVLISILRHNAAKTSPSGVHSEHILKERQRRAKCSESFHL